MPGNDQTVVIERRAVAADRYGFLCGIDSGGAACRCVDAGGLDPLVAEYLMLDVDQARDRSIAVGRAK
jgi:hypothetical protein